MNEVAATTGTPVQDSPQLWSAFVFWYFRKVQALSKGQSSYEKLIRPIAVVNSVNAFWDVYSHLLRPGKIPNNMDYHFFRKGIKPIWEDDFNRKGGKWMLRMKKGLASKFWEDMLLGIVGNQFEDSEHICGAVLSVRYYEDVLSLWIGTTEPDVVERARCTFLAILQLPESTPMDFKKHDQSLRDIALAGSRVANSASSAAVAASTAAGSESSDVNSVAVQSSSKVVNLSTAASLGNMAGPGEERTRRPVEIKTSHFEPL